MRNLRVPCFTEMWAEPLVAHSRKQNEGRYSWNTLKMSTIIPNSCQEQLRGHALPELVCSSKENLNKKAAVVNKAISCSK